MEAIRFTILKIKLQMPEDCRLPRHKVSAIRGGMGNVLLAQHCIRDGKCEFCDFQESCIVQNIMYAPFRIKPSFANQNESMGYVIDCTSKKVEYHAGESLWVEFTLFGNAISYIMPIIYALTSLGGAGLGKEAAPFQVTEIVNRRRKPILRDGCIAMRNVLVETVESYVNERIAQQVDPLENQAGHVWLSLETPCAVKHQGEFLQAFDGHSLVLAMIQKLYMYQLYEGKQAEKEHFAEEEFPAIKSQRLEPGTIPRYSATQERKMYLKGITGVLELEGCTEKVMRYLYAMEILHLGKNTRLGFGKVTVRNHYDIS